MFPRSMWVGGQLKMCGQVGDFAISAGHRSLGPALLLQRATFEPVDSRSCPSANDCPRPRSAAMATFSRLGVQPNCAVARYVLPLRVDGQFRKRLGFTPPFLPGYLQFAAALVRSAEIESERAGNFRAHQRV